MRAHSSVISPRGVRARIEDLAEVGPAMGRQRVSRVRLARRVSRRARWVAAGDKVWITRRPAAKVVDKGIASAHHPMT